MIEVIGKGESWADYSLAHYFEQNGDLMADPEMVVRVFSNTKSAYALSYKLDSLGVNQEVYIERNSERLVNVRLRKQLNSFLGMWLGNLISQGFSVGGGERDD